MDITTSSETDTAKLAQKLAHETRAPCLYCLYGDLGAGKSTFARGFIQGLISPYTEVPSPTFTLVQTYETDKGTIYHFDLYRLEDPEEVFELGWDDALAEGIVLVEWPERLGSLLPEARTNVRLTQVDTQTRKIEIHGQEA